MKGLLIKDILTLKKQGKLLAILLAFYVVLGLAMNEMAAFGSMVIVVCAMLPVTAMSYDERAGWDKYALSMPVTRRDIVLSKYVLGLIFCAIAVVVVAAFGVATHPEQIAGSLASALVMGATGLIFQSILFPLFFKYGVERGRLLMLAVILLPAGLGILLARMDLGLPSPTPQMVAAVPYLLAAVTVACIAVSIAVSLHIYRRKEI